MILQTRIGGSFPAEDSDAYRQVDAVMKPENLGAAKIDGVGKMATIVLLHGGGAGGWMWRYVGPRLTAAGHSVFTPTFTGVGDRRHLISRDLTHWTHVLDIANLLEFEEIEDAVLVGYSYGGSVIPGVVSEQPGRVSKAIIWMRS